MADDKKPDEKEPQMARGRSEGAPVFDAKADKLYEQRRAGLLPPDSQADRSVLAARKVKADAVAAARAARSAAARQRGGPGATGGV